MSTKSNKPEEMLLRVIRVAELLAKGAAITAENRQDSQPTRETDPEQKTQAMHFHVS
ncbi:hypothetical protein G4Y79_18840 [Phototrophicus methaneseepsis]|uniref:Uncharacterized protein n=1 Tax=Phototrophicus methaneseepsis TaxID=2710758 RepID=A0A7S8E7E7_9CHLR|nr:hypothetical protein [Phototrophicus methaneseepsis]QPC81729.1 hypothetical protein G4Y79_18840 [Phototrophicus methaneseepsis]